MNNTLKNRLQYHVTGAIERGEAQAIVEKTTLRKGPFPLHITQNDDHFVVITNLGNHYAKTFDPSAARLIAAAPELLDALQSCVSELNQLAFLSGDKLAGPAIQKGLDAIAKAKGE